jgi:uncharacterized membrane protein
MLKELFMVYGSGYFGGGAIETLFAKWQQAGIFSYVLPFILIYALVFGILMKVNLFSIKKGEKSEPNKGINAMIALAVSLMSLQFDFVPFFFAEIFPRLGVGIAIILVLIVVAGLFIKPTKEMGNFLMIVSLVIVVVIIYQSLSSFGWSFSTFGGGWIVWNNIWPILVFAGIIIAIVASTKTNTSEDKKSIVEKLLGAE